MSKVLYSVYIFSSCYHVGNMKRTFEGQFLESKFACEKSQFIAKKLFFYFLLLLIFFFSSIAFPRNDYSGVHKHEKTMIFIKGRKVKVNLISEVYGFTDPTSPLQ